jgi:hypothetical protein
LERIWKEPAVAYSKKLSWNLPGGTEDNNKRPVRTVSVLAEIQTEYFSNIGSQVAGSIPDEVIGFFN